MNDPTKVVFQSDCANAPEGGSLDTLAQVRKRARSKYVLQPLILALIDQAKADPEGGEMLKSYWGSYHCAGVLEQNGQKLTSKYCNQRWCLVCSRIRTAKLINKYQSHFQRMEEPQFVTLTAPTVTEEELPERIKGMKKQVKDIQEVMRKRGTPLVGVIKIECTYNPEADRYHPHFHVLIEGEYESNTLNHEWLKRNPTASDKAQNITKADENTLLEVFKYTAKHCSKGRRTMNAKALHAIYKALRGVRTFQPVGGFGTEEVMVPEEGEEIQLQSQTYNWLQSEECKWVWNGHDWYNDERALTGYTPSEAIEQFRNNLEQWNVNTVMGNLPQRTSSRNTVQTDVDNEHFTHVKHPPKRQHKRPLKPQQMIIQV